MTMDTHDKLQDVPDFEVSRPRVKRYNILPRSRLRVPMKTKMIDISGEHSEPLLCITSDSESDPDLSYSADGFRWGECSKDASADDSDLNLIPPHIYQSSPRLSCCRIECSLM